MNAETFESPVSCKICGKTFASFRGLNGHMNAHLPAHHKRAETFEASVSEDTSCASCGYNTVFALIENVGNWVKGPGMTPEQGIDYLTDTLEEMRITLRRGDPVYCNRSISCMEPKHFAKMKHSRAEQFAASGSGLSNKAVAELMESQFWNDWTTSETPVNPGWWNLTISVRDFKLWSRGIKPNRFWKVSDAKKYFNIVGGKESLVTQIEAIQQFITGLTEGDSDAITQFEEVVDQYVIMDFEAESETFEAEYAPSVEGMIDNPAGYYSCWQGFCEYIGVTTAHMAWRMVEKPWKWRPGLERWVKDPEWFTQEAETFDAEGGEPTIEDFFRDMETALNKYGAWNWDSEARDGDLHISVNLTPTNGENFWQYDLGFDEMREDEGRNL